MENVSMESDPVVFKHGRLLVWNVESENVG